MRTLACPECAAESIRLPVFDVRRRRERSCPECGASVEIVVPGFVYYTVTGALSLAGSAIVPLCIFWWLTGETLWIALTLTMLFAALLATGPFLNAYAGVQSLENPRKKAAQAAGQWYPD